MSAKPSSPGVSLAREPDDLPDWLIADPRRADVVAFMAGWPRPVYLVGGSVRDALLGRETVDLDFTVEGHAIPLARALADRVRGALVVMDSERDVARVVFGCREGVQHWDVAGLRAPTIDDDLRARDVTINALALPVRPPHVLLDPAGGLADLRRALLRAASDQAFADDPIRVVRLARFRGELGFAVQPATRRLAQQAAVRLQRSSPERVRDELLALLKLPCAWHAVRYLRRLGALGYVLRGMPALAASSLDAGLGCLRAVEHWSGGWCVGDELAPPNAAIASLATTLGHRWSQVLAGGRTRWQAVKLAAILQPVSPDAAEMVCEALRLSNAEVRLVSGAVAATHELRRGLLGGGDLALYRYFRRHGDAGLDGAVLALARWSLPDALLALRAWVGRHAEVVDPPRLVTGCDVMRVCGIEAGPMVGATLEAVREAQVTGELSSRQQALAWLEQLATGTIREN